MTRFTELPPRRRLLTWSVVLGLILVGVPRLHRENLLAEGGPTAEAVPLPEFRPGARRWIGTAPMTTADLHGRVWVLKVWTFGCLNCVRSIPFTNELLERHGAELGVLGIHSPEFDWERDPDALEAALHEYDVRFPTYLDTSDHYFNALEAPGWPAYYVVDRQARIRGRWVGEMHAGTGRARAMDELIRALIDERSVGAPPAGG